MTNKFGKGATILVVVLLIFGYAFFTNGLRSPLFYKKFVVPNQNLTIYLPPGWQFLNEPGVDVVALVPSASMGPYVGKFKGDGIELFLESGESAGPLLQEDRPDYLNYDIMEEIIAGHKAQIVTPSVPGGGITGIRFDGLKNINTLNLYGKALTAEQKRTVFKIFKTIKFD